MEAKEQPSAVALAEAEALMQELKPTLARMIERNDPAVQGLTFSDIEGNAAAAGDLLAKLMMVRALERERPLTAAEEQAARAAAYAKAESKRRKRAAADLQMTHIPKRRRTLKTARGEITFERDYLHFPELGTGVFPPRDTPENSSGRTDPAGNTTVARNGRRG